MIRIYDNPKTERREIIKDGKVQSWYSKTNIQNDVEKNKSVKPFGYYALEGSPACKDPTL